MSETDEIHTADAVALAHTDDEGWLVLMISREWEPYEGHWAIPGGHIDEGENPQYAAARELAEETGIDVPPGVLARFGRYDTPGRDPRGPYVSHVYVTVLDHPPTPLAADDARQAVWQPLNRITHDQLAFDHQQILTDIIAANSDYQEDTMARRTTTYVDSEGSTVTRVWEGDRVISTTIESRDGSVTNTASGGSVGIQSGGNVNGRNVRR